MRIPGYDVLEPFATFARSSVYRGRHAADHRPVLLQVPSRLPARSHDLELLDRQLAIAREAAGAGVATVRELNQRGDVPCLVWDDPGLDVLAARIGTARRPLEWVLGVASALAVALEALHDRGVVAGAVAPSGVLVDEPGARACLLDLELASRSSADGITQPIAAVPTPYTSPEQTGRINRAVDYRSDF
jgi:serine/threonine protein kinase